MIRADEAPAAPMAELVRRPGLPGGAGDDDDPGPERGREQVGGSDLWSGARRADETDTRRSACSWGFSASSLSSR
jgi:hypothetical protein